ncbi:MAM domain-containing glycosylphosphatidylinositol anchor protein 2-like [Centroberyx affinis]|uniref:MAM domain-containing glycosylphosphatidylinositol anchor protein 2-like n=1 Tax=Centroberyx affinis TaxID=166261 RepID=UPI003A5C3C42
MYGNHVGTLKVYINDRKIHTGGDEEGILQWTETGNQGDKWQEASVSVEHRQPFWFVFVYQRGMNTGGDVALDDITTLPGPCYSEPPTKPPATHDSLSIGLAVSLTLLAGVVISVVLFMLNRKRCIMIRPKIMKNEDQNSVFDLYDCRIDGTQHGSESDFSFFNNLYNPSGSATETTVATSDA